MLQRYQSPSANCLHGDEVVIAGTEVTLASTRACGGMLVKRGQKVTDVSNVTVRTWLINHAQMVTDLTT
jgi:hypothetical protein